MPIVENVYRQEPLPLITQEMLFSKSGYIPVENWPAIQCVPFCEPQQPNLAVDFVEALAKGFVAAAGTYYGAQIFKKLIR